MGKRPPCVKGAVRREERAYDWGIAFRKCEAITMKDNPSDLAALGHLPLHKGGFFSSGKAIDTFLSFPIPFWKIMLYNRQNYKRRDAQ
jgi:hypothetical protein